MVVPKFLPNNNNPLYDISWGFDNVYNAKSSESKQIMSIFLKTSIKKKKKKINAKYAKVIIA